MTEYEYLDLAFEYTESIATHAVNFMTVVFAYVVAAHLGGSKLPKSFAILLSLSYSLFLLGPLFGIYFPIEALVPLVTQYRIAYPDGAFLHGGNKLFVLIYTMAPRL